MLGEGLMLLLMQKGIISGSEATELIDEIIAVKREMAGTSESVVVSLASIGLLRAVSQSVSAFNEPSPPLAA